MNGPLLTSPMQEYRTSARRKMLHQGMVIGIENHSPFGKNMQCAVVELNYGLKGLIYEDQFDRRKYSSLVGFLGHKIDFMVLDVTKLGQDDTKVNVFDEEKGIVLLSRVQAIDELQEEFWSTAELNHIVTGEVGIFIKLAPGIESLAWFPPANKMPKDGILVGKRVSVRIKNINADKRRIGSKIVDFPYEI
ncbi:small subunit ribosomal protein S1 [Paenibacillus sp. UNC496MF]|uniref:hypothetical protein n=1 Tax=Paenibacillus sp. UNC496MF TaxID=1502753 RepID=UPI0008EC481E|nr:hypothetical protein [Paenibacillus sp. UNC496MF]SFJ77115.1 small subunit ribosomal protein S1 [Paenibacillus sp. UNC496MF]